MNRLWVRLTLALGLVTLVGVGTVALLTNWQAAEQFRVYVVRQDVQTHQTLLEALAAYYQETGSWEGVAEVIHPAVPVGDSGRHGQLPLLLADAAGLIVYDERQLRLGETLTAAEQAEALPVEVEGQSVGYLVVRWPWRGGGPETIEQNFLNRLGSTLVIATLLAGGLSLVLGMVLSRMLAAPLANLAQAARTFGARHWDHRIRERGTAEVVEAARAFNEMAASLQQAETLRRDLMADVAHELRTPLTVLQGNLRAMLDGVYPLERSEIAILYDEIRLLSRLVDDLRELALAEAGQLPLNLQRLDLAPLLTTVATNFGVAADTKNVPIKLEVAASLPPVQADVDRVRQVLINLLSNALRHTPEGGQITLSAQASGANVLVAVTDTGAGIASADLPHIFDRFYRGDESRARLQGQGGTGLGLSIAKAWVQALGGTIGVESTVGQGSRFWFTLPQSR